MSAFKYINGKIIYVEHKTVYGRLIEVSGIHQKMIEPIYDTEVLFAKEGVLSAELKFWQRS